MPNDRDNSLTGLKNWGGGDLLLSLFKKWIEWERLFIFALPSLSPSSPIFMVIKETLI
jgi:hypothetical protein